MIGIFGVDVPIIAAISLIVFLIPIILVSFNVTDVEYLTQDQLTHKTKKLVFSVLLLLLYIIFIMMLDYMNAYSSGEIIPGEIRCYLDLIDSTHVIGSNESLILIGIFYALALVYANKRGSSINNLPLRKKRMELEKQWVIEYNRYSEITALIDEIEEDIYLMEKPIKFRFVKMKRVLISILDYLRTHLSKFTNLLFSIYRKRSELIGMVGPVLVIMIFKDMNFYRHLFLFITLLFTIRTITKMVAIHFDDEINFALDSVYKNLHEYRKTHKEELIWVTNSKRHSIYKFNEKGIFVLVHRDNGIVEVAKRLDKFYNRSKSEEGLIIELENDITSIKEFHDDFLKEYDQNESEKRG